MTRYTGWRRLSGDTADRPDLFDFGKKLLGYLDQQRRLSSVRTCAIERTLPDGSIVRARFDYDIPSIEVLEVKPMRIERSESDLLEGLIVRPSPAAVDQATNAAKNHVLLRPLSDLNWRPHFFDAAAVPEDFEDKHGFYGTVPHLPPLFPEGIGRYGNVDWRNADESVMVTFHGPESRYFYDAAHSFRNKVYFKGQLLFDLATVELPLLALSNGTVLGACLRAVEDAGICLLVVVRHGTTERLLRIPVSVTATARRVGPNIKWQEAAALESASDLEQIAVLQTWSPDLDGAVPYHPWMFNQSGTQAKRMTPGVLSSHEETLVCEDGETATYGVIVHVWDMGSRVTHVEYTAAPTPADVTEIDGSTNYYRAAQTTASFLDTVLAYDETVTEAFPDPWVLYAVDFRDDAPVYAHLRRSTLVAVTDYDRPLLYTFTKTGTDTYPLHEVDVEEASHTLTATRTTTEVCGGLRTDWMEHVADPSVSTLSHSETCDESTSITYDDLAAPGDPANVQITAASGTIDYSFTRTSATRIAAFVIGYLDLRYRIALYGRFTELVSRGRTATVSLDLGDYPLADADRLGSTGYGTPVVPAGTISKAVTTYLTAELSVNGVVAWSVSEQQMAPTDSTPEAQEDIYLHNATNSFQGHIVRGLSIGRLMPSGDYLHGDLRVWVAGTPDPGDAGSYSDVLDETLDNSGAFDNASLQMREAAISGNSSAQTNDYPDTVNNVRFGAWQAYRGRYGYSMTYSANGALTHAYGLGDLDGVPSLQTLPELTGSLEPRFHPVGVLTPTAIPRP